MMDLMPPGGGDGGVADHGVATSMQVVVKAANQKYNDQTIQCQGSWTVKKLKSHLAEVYPCKPKENQQKIIFSGRLLQDHLVLKDVLRSFDPDCPTTVHLVCAPGVDSKENSPAPDANVPASSSETASTTTTPSSSAVRRRTNVTTLSTAVGIQPAEASASISNQVPSSAAQFLPPSQYPQNWHADAYNAWLQQYYTHAQQHQSSSGDGAGSDYQNMYQQYWQYYIYMQYAQYIQAAGGFDTHRNSQATGSVADAAPIENAPAQPVVAGNANNGEANAAAPAAAVGAAGGGGAMFEEEDDDGRNRDWLDWLYVGSRLGVLLSIIYFYSTVGRFMLVFGFCFLVYVVRNHLYANRNHNHRNRRNNNRPAENAAADAAAEVIAAAVAAEAPAAAPVDPPAPVADDAAPAGAPVGDIDPGEAVAQEERGPAEGENEDEAQPAVPQQEGPSPWSMVVTIITAFFSSLVPQPPPAN